MLLASAITEVPDLFWRDFNVISWRDLGNQILNEGFDCARKQAANQYPYIDLNSGYIDLCWTKERNIIRHSEVVTFEIHFDKEKYLNDNIKNMYNVLLKMLLNIFNMIMPTRNIFPLLSILSKLLEGLNG